MSEEMIVRHCSPTLAGMKTGNMFVCAFSSAKEMTENLRKWNRIFGKKGLRVLPLRYKNGHALIYIYRPARLSSDLKHSTAVRLLQERGYGVDTTAQCISHLIRRLNESDDFPHEIGLFLGYPPEDVDGFIENKADSFKLVGCWKVYGDVDSAQKLFAKYKKCTEAYATQLSKGRSIERLAVAG